jgi:L-asparagine transporter-like permease
MSGRWFLRSPSWILAVVSVLSGIAGWYLMSRALHGEGPLDLGFYWVTLILGLLAYAVCGVSARVWLRNAVTGRHDAKH